MTVINDFIGDKKLTSDHGFVVPIRPALLMRLREIRELRDGYALINARNAHFVVEAFSPKVNDATATHKRRARIKSRSAKEQLMLFEAGFYLHFDRIEILIEPVRAICEELARDLGVDAELVTAGAFVTNAPNAADPHVDPVTTLHVQLHGRKTWWLGRAPAKKCFPLAIEEAKLPKNSERFDVDPGSVVVLPPGCIHATKTDGPSLGIAFTINGESAADRITRDALKRLSLEAVLRAPALYRRRRSDRAAANLVAANALRALADELESFA